MKSKDLCAQKASIFKMLFVAIIILSIIFLNSSVTFGATVTQMSAPSAGTYSYSLSGVFISQTRSDQISLKYGSYSNFNTHVFAATLSYTEAGYDLSNQAAFCTNHQYHNGVAGDTVTAYIFEPDDSGYDWYLAALVYYGYGGAGTITDTSDDAYYVTSHAVYKYLYPSTKNSDAEEAIEENSNYYKKLVAKAKTAQSTHTLDGLDSLNGTFSYILYYPSDVSTDQIIISGAVKAENGNLKIVKEDSNGNKIANVTFKVTSDNGYSSTIKTTSNDGITIENLEPGTYYIQEIDVDGENTHLVLNSNVANVTVKSNETVTYTMENDYQRGSATLTKYDADNPGDTKGDATLEGAVYELYANENIYEGPDLIYKKGQKIDVGKIVTAADGTTKVIDDLPIGKYYYVEVSPSPGFKTNGTHIEFEVEYEENASKAGMEYNTASEEPVYTNVEITKSLSETDYDAQINLAGTQFKATLKSDSSQVYYSNVSGSDGKCTISDLPYGVYIISEIQWPETVYEPVADFEVDLRVSEEDDGKTFDYSLVNKSKTIQVEIFKSLVEEALGKTDAKISGAVFTIYTDEACTTPYIDKNGNVVTLKIEDIKSYTTAGYEALGYVISGKMRTGIYYVKETTFPEGINPDATIPGDTVTYREKVYTFGSLPEDQEEENVVYSLGSTSDPIRNMPYLGRVSVIKFDNDSSGSDESPAKGAVLRLTLDSSIGTDAEVYYDVTINSDGYGNFWNEDFAEYDPNTIPYGEYTITEVKSSDDGQSYFYYIQGEAISITYQGDSEERIVSDEPVPAYLKIVKKDADTGETVELAGTKFKIWSVDNNDWVTFQTQHVELTELVTNDEGWLMTPQQLEPGTYVIYETEVAEGYYLEENLRIPENEKYLGDTTYGGIEVVVDKVTTGLANNAQYPTGGDTSNLLIEVNVSDRPLKVQIEVYKTGEMLVDATNNETDYGTKYTPVWDDRGLEGVVYDVYAVDDVMSSDGRITYYSAGEKVSQIETGEDGYGLSDELYPGTYRLVEVVTPEGYLKDDNIPDITLTNEDPYERVKLYQKDLNDIRQKLELTFKKIFEELEYSASKEVEQTAVFGVYTNEDIENYVSSVVIPKDSLVDVITVTGNNQSVTSTIDLPEGLYYVQELDVSSPYVVSDEMQEFKLEYTSDSSQEFVVIEGEDIENTYDTSSIVLLKLSTTSTAADKILSLYGEDLTDEALANLDSLSKEIATAVNEMTVEETLEYLNELLSSDLTDEEKDRIITVAGVTYQVFVDPDCIQPLYKKNEETGEYTDLAIVTTTLTGTATIDGIPYGVYYVKEVDAPDGYEVSDDVVEIVVSEVTGIPKVFQITYDDSVIGNMITKTDIFTGDVVPDCTFEITDEDGNVLVHAVTDEEGNAYIPVDIFEDGKTYYYTEIDAPDIYELNTEAHEFVAEIDEETGEWIAKPIEVENVRKTGTVQIIKSDADTGERLEGCVFTIVLLDDDGNEYVNANGETIYLVKDAVTDENGEYLIEDVPYGTYKFVEMVAPEGYELDEDMTGLTFTVSDEATYIVFEVTNTGDIAVIAITGVLILSIIGIAIVISRKKLAN